MRLALVIAPIAAAQALLYYLGRTWGSTADERSQALPGDDIVAGAALAMDHAITIDAPPQEVWPWLVQVGWGRAGWYTYRWVDQLLFPNNGPSAEEILPQYQVLKVGDRIPDGPPESACFFTVRGLEENRSLTLHSTTHLPPALLQRPGYQLSWTWTFAVSEESAGRSRFHLRVRGTVRPWWLLACAHLLVVPADFVMGRSMCKGLKRRVEGLRTLPGDAGLSGQADA